MQQFAELTDKTAMRSLVFGLFVYSACGLAAGTAAQTAVQPDQLPSLEPTVRRFDFEEPEAAPGALPAHFYRYIAPRQGFPPFGAMRLTMHVDFSSASGGASEGGSFEFELAGGSMSARVPTSIIQVMPLCDYSVSVMVKTDGLRHARARLVAWLHDKSGDPIHQSRAQSRLTLTNGSWESLHVEIQGDFADAADLVLELQVVQPGQFAESNEGSDDRPRLQDVSGRVWFDDVRVSRLPRLMVSLEERDRVVTVPDGVQLRVLVSEPSTRTLSARIRVLDLDGQTVFDSTIAAPRGPHVEPVHLPITTCGWYQAIIEVLDSHGNSSRRQSLDFIIAPDQAPGAINPAWILEWQAQRTGSRTSFEEGTPRQRVADAMVGALQSWRDAISQKDIAAASQMTKHRPAEMSPDPVLAALQTLAQQLTGRMFSTELNIGEGVHAWILIGPDVDDAALVAWNEGADSVTTSILQTQLATEPIEVVDAFGNRARIDPINGIHTIALSNIPAFIENVDLELVQFRAGVKIEPPVIMVASKLQEHRVVLTNPWNFVVYGTIRFRSSDRLEFSPTSHHFVLQPRDTLRLPLSIVPERGMTTGVKHICAEINLEADQEYEFELPIAIDTETPSIDLVASWSIHPVHQADAGDLTITTAVTNRAGHTINVEVFLQTEGISHTRRLIPALKTGETAVRTFHITNGGRLLAGKQIRVSAVERDSSIRADRMLLIAPQRESATKSPQAAASDY